jgi:hypothetical protein
MIVAMLIDSSASRRSFAFSLRFFLYDVAFRFRRGPLPFFLRSDKVESNPISTAKPQVESGREFLLLSPVIRRSVPTPSISIHITLKKPSHLIL